MSLLPSGRVTFPFTDIEASTLLIQESGPTSYAVRAHGGHEFGAEGDAHFFVFRHAADAVRAAVDGQRALAAVFTSMLT